jgi:hypothetical protein
MSAPIHAPSPSPTGQSRQHRSLARHGPSGLRAVAGATPAAHRGSERCRRVQVALGHVVECRRSARGPQTGRKTDAIVPRQLLAPAWWASPSSGGGPATATARSHSRESARAVYRPVDRSLPQQCLRQCRFGSRCIDTRGARRSAADRTSVKPQRDIFTRDARCRDARCRAGAAGQASGARCRCGHRA